MWSRIGSWLKKLLFGVTPVEPEPIQPERKAISTSKLNPWPFEGEAPPQEAVQKLYDGLQSVGDHIKYRAPETGRWQGVVQHEGREYLTKELTYWIADGTLKEGHRYLNVRAECGEQKCARPDHLKVKYAPSKNPKTPQRAQPKLQVNRVQGPPEYKAPAKPKHTGKSKDELLSGDRTICPSAKVFYPTLEEAKSVAAYYNNHFRPSGQQRLYGYDCDWCAGNHLTHHNPEKHKFKHKGSW